MYGQPDEPKMPLPSPDYELSFTITASALFTVETRDPDDRQSVHYLLNLLLHL